MKELLYEGKAKKVFYTEEPEELLLEYKDDATAFNGKKKESFRGKGELNNKISSKIFTLLEEKGTPTHFLKELSDTEQLVTRTSIIPLEVVVRNKAAGSLVRRIGIEDEMSLHPPLIELFYKNDDLDDPLINDRHALLLADVTHKELMAIKEEALKVNDVLLEIFEDCDLSLVDFKLEFGRTEGGDLLLSDEVSPDTCRLRDKQTGAKMDKDVFREGTGELVPVYENILQRLEGATCAK
ncbi:phosphoribosylaminoimidazolesuccinocarboxamide synthase [Salimicrobium salexigens]|uniref:Phosphoribosylaminoimidazole-succinocarboxamide synthase n=1 Tax=Salimicrobium salexigens TaxID=908941 RepID=A0ABY1KTR0_9BACI|nr:phosphoribosylaminoimidazolesuccinocarboxamide synthase [Salimicrobium salexigens]SIS76054.1 phosphoribosylaminoimidazole-succinocarboxamide synthase [Salimicrobium salexigens]